MRDVQELHADSQSSRFETGQTAKQPPKDIEAPAPRVQLRFGRGVAPDRRVSRSKAIGGALILIPSGIGFGCCARSEALSFAPHFQTLRTLQIKLQI